MEDISLIQGIGIFIFILFAGFIDSMAGGGGLITIPTYLAAGVPAPFILGTNKCVSCCSKSLSIFRYIKNKKIDFKFILPPTIAAFIASLIGARLSSILDSKHMVYILILVIPFIFIMKYLKGRRGLVDPSKLEKTQVIIRSSIIGLMIGGYDGFFGPGTGTFLIISMMFFLHFDILKASPHAAFINYTSNVAAFITFLIKGVIMWKVVAIALPAGLIGNYLGSNQVLKENRTTVTTAFNVVLVGLLVKSIYDISMM
ncbi:MULTISPECIES: sulfite exporter TauE/SafE family protein [Halobacteriovorax]|uniref:Probable membrane transporter protein n=1 Tax=Halobacteriovorax vibrionivorans TaxID=2152716 RepID=A0ABY0IF55_9BACT|nr:MULTISPECIES: TSUP family transporter [Halobacteriovorax]AYF44247.1 sulfite exporter TauE/SafE [Halobacteriovorax sp. BALOs_7]RZF21225.1 sulfite exporter TauE/SafE family protein [Halobacteriovorax vibrionivorans]TGD48017.1 sulfite exporter TauE/SafE family protein [Halobacteriovorax sp. Y22]